MVNNGKPYYEGQSVKTMMLRLNIILLVIGLCQVSCILVSIQNALELNVIQKVETVEEIESNEEQKRKSKIPEVSEGDNEGREIDVVSIEDRENDQGSS